MVKETCEIEVEVEGARCICARSLCGWGSFIQGHVTASMPWQEVLASYPTPACPQGIHAASPMAHLSCVAV